MDHVSSFEHGGVRAIYRDVLGLEIIYGGEGGCFSSLRIEDAPYLILNLEQGEPVTRWGRLIFHVEDVDACLDIPAGKGISSGESARRLLGRTLFPHARPGWARAVVCAPALAVFQQPDELIGGEEKLAKVFVQHALAHVLPGMGFPEGNNLRKQLVTLLEEPN
jgi:hypothetical protein